MIVVRCLRCLLVSKCRSPERQIQDCAGNRAAAFHGPRDEQKQQGKAELNRRLELGRVPIRKDFDVLERGLKVLMLLLSASLRSH